jgi:signal transduction histidine kinase
MSDVYIFSFTFSSSLENTLTSRVNILLSDLVPLHLIADRTITSWITGAIISSIIFLAGYLYKRYLKSVYDQKFHNLKLITEHQQKLIRSELATMERERNRIAKELHDGVGTNLTAIKLTVNQLLENYKEPLAGNVEEQFQATLNEIKDIIYGLTPPGLERYGLFIALKNYVERINKNIPVTISLQSFGEDLTRQKYDLNVIIFRVIQDLISLSVKHACAKKITIHLNSFNDLVNLIYEDDGICFKSSAHELALQIEFIRSKIESINGILRFDVTRKSLSCAIDIPLTADETSPVLLNQ